MLRTSIFIISVILTDEPHNAGLQLRRANTSELKELDYLRSMRSRRQLQGFVGGNRIRDSGYKNR